MNEPLLKIGILMLVSFVISGCNPANYGWSDCDQEIETMFSDANGVFDTVDTTIEKEEPSGWFWGNDEPEDAWFVTQTFNFVLAGGAIESHHLTFNSAGSRCQVK